MYAESKLDTHDVNLPLPSPKEAPGTRYLRFILLSSADHDMTAVHQRVERLENLSGGCDAALVWLLGEGGDGASAFLHFQLKYDTRRLRESAYHGKLTSLHVQPSGQV